MLRNGYELGAVVVTDLTRSRVLEISKKIIRNGLAISLPQYMAPGDGIALGELLHTESFEPFQFHVHDVSALVERILKEQFPNASIVR